MRYPPDEVVSKLWFITLWPRGRMVRRLYQYGAFVGVRVAHRHDGAWWFRHHVLTMTGPRDRVRRFQRVANRVISGKRGRAARREAAASAAELLRRLETAPSASTSAGGG